MDLNPNLIKLLIILLNVFVFSLIYYLINIGNNYLGEERKIVINRRKALYVLAALLLVVFYKYLSNKYLIISDTVGTLIVSLVLAYVFNPLVNRLEKKKIKREYGILIIYLIIFALILVLSFLVVPKAGKEIKSLITNFPRYLDKWSETMDSIYDKYYVNIDNMPDIFETAKETLLKNIENIQNAVFGSVSRFFTGIASTFSKLVSLVLIPILTFYFLKDKEEFKDKAKNLIPEKYREESLDLFRKIDKSLGMFIRGRLILAIYVGVTTTILLLVLKIDFALVIGFITGIADIIPYVGPFLGFLPAVFFAFISSPSKGIWVAIIFLIIQWVENNVLAPKIIGQSTGIHPLTILLSLVIGGGIFGVIGMIFSVPFVAVVKILAEFIREKYYKDKKVSKKKLKKSK